jgi:hypothetical protein
MGTRQKSLIKVLHILILCVRSPSSEARSSRVFNFADKNVQQNPFAGWSSPVARQAHNLKVVSSNLAPATKYKPLKS